MLNNKGWGLQAMMIWILVLMFALLVTSVLINKLNRTFNIISDYPEYEQKIVEASKKYQNDYNKNSIITLDELKKNNYIEKSNCTGYVLDNKAYINCDDYMTEGYNQNLDNY